MRTLTGQNSAKAKKALKEMRAKLFNCSIKRTYKSPKLISDWSKEFHYYETPTQGSILRTEKDLVIPIKNKLIGERNAAIIKAAAAEKESKGKALVYNLTMDGSTAIHFSFGCLIDALKYECEDMDDESLMNMEFTVSFKQMTDKEIEDLPEFDGF